MDWRIVRTIALKDLQLVRQNKMAWIPAVVVPLVFLVLLPAAFILVPTLVEIPTDEML